MHITSTVPHYQLSAFVETKSIKFISFYILLHILETLCTKSSYFLMCLVRRRNKIGVLINSWLLFPKSRSQLTFSTFFILVSKYVQVVSCTSVTLSLWYIFHWISQQIAWTPYLKGLLIKWNLSILIFPCLEWLVTLHTSRLYKLITY